MTPTPWTVLVVDDEAVARRRLVRLTTERLRPRLVAEASGGREAVELVTELAPDLVFLDVQMPDLSGFEVIEAVGAARMPTTVFVTAYDQHALRAFDVNAVDYLLKPYDTERFDLALERARARLEARRGAPSVDDEARLRALVRDAVAEAARGASAAVPYQQVAVRTDGALKVLALTDVDWIETEGNYARMHVGRESHLIRQTLTRLEQSLDPRRFVRVHRRFLVNLARVVEVQPWFAGDAVLILRDGTKLRLSRTYREFFHARMLRDHTESASDEPRAP